MTSFPLPPGNSSARFIATRHRNGSPRHRGSGSTIVLQTRRELRNERARLRRFEDFVPVRSRQSLTEHPIQTLEVRDVLEPTLDLFRRRADSFLPNEQNRLPCVLHLSLVQDGQKR